MVDSPDRKKRLTDAFISEYGTHIRTNPLEECFALQAGFMAMLREDGRFPDWPLDLSSKDEQRKLQSYLWDTVREIAEASATLRNRVHRVKEESFSRSEFLEEMADAFAFFMESLMLAGFGHDDLIAEYRRKNAVVRRALLDNER